MKIDGLTHPKTKDLAIQLGIPVPHAVGLLEYLWYFVGKQTPRGDIGKWSNGVIAAESQWDGDADEFVQALVNCRFLDECKDHRLVVHDWSDHAPRWVFAKLKKEKKEILSPNLSENLRRRYKCSVVKCSEVKGKKPFVTSETDVTPDDDENPEKDPPKSSKPDPYPSEFEELWKSRPPRQGSDNKRKALKPWNARRREGYTNEQMMEGMERYKRFLSQSGKLGTEYVMMTATFLGPDKHFLEDWDHEGGKANGKSDPNEDYWLAGAT